MGDSAEEVDGALSRLLLSVEPVDTETLGGFEPDEIVGRVLADTARLDRDSPACDVSAMDGYAVRAAEINAGPITLAGECRIGQPPETLPPGTAMRIYTGSPLPDGADAVVRLERAQEDGGAIELKEGVLIEEQTDVRHRGENANRGDAVLDAGRPLTPAALAAVASIGPEAVGVCRRIRVAIITTGDELAGPGEEVPPWRLRDSNGPTLRAMLAPLPWIESATHEHAVDDLDGLAERIAAALEGADAVVLTGGVSKGAYDFVPEAVVRASGERVFHRIRARPGQPTFGAVARGKPVLGLPGNPLSVLTTARRLLVPALRRRAGFAAAEDRLPQATLNNPDGKSIPLTWWRPVRITAHGVAELVRLKGSGDTCGPATSDGFVEISPGDDGAGPFAYYGWNA